MVIYHTVNITQVYNINVITSNSGSDLIDVKTERMYDVIMM